MRFYSVKLQQAVTSNTIHSNVPAENRRKLAVEVNGTTFRILSDSLYTHKVAAVLREISCNAYDAHVMVGKQDVPFDVILPTPSHPRFIVRDYGPGLSNDEFVDVYTTYFKSTKSNSDDFIGCLGLGSKTPFIMSPSFTVYSYHNGMEDMWHAFVNDNGEPDVQLIYSKPNATCQSGIKVVVPIGHDLGAAQLANLCDEFAATAKEIYEWFNVAPNLSNGDGTEAISILPKLDPEVYTSYSVPLNGHKVKVWIRKIDAASFNDRQHTILVKMGNVVYPYDLDRANVGRFAGNVLKIDQVVNHLKNSQINTPRYPFVIELNIGDASVAPSREALSLTTTTEQNVLSAMVNGLDVYARTTQHQINGGTTPYGKYSLYFSIPTAIREMYSITVDGAIPPDDVWNFSKAGTRNLKNINPDNLWLRIRRSGRVALDSKQSMQVSMYKKYHSASFILLIDAPYKGELREWVKANFKPKDYVLVVGSPTNARYVLDPVQIKVFEAEGHPNIVKMSELKQQPVVRPRANSRIAAPSKGTVINLRRDWTSSNMFREGNIVGTVTTKEFIEEANNNPNRVYIVTVRVNGEVKSDFTKDFIRIAGWVKSNSKTWTGCGMCNDLSALFASPPCDLEFSLSVTNTRTYKDLIALNLPNVVSVDGAVNLINTHPSRPVQLTTTRDCTQNPVIESIQRIAGEIIASPKPLNKIDQKWFDWISAATSIGAIDGLSGSWATVTNRRLSLGQLMVKLSAQKKPWCDILVDFFLYTRTQQHDTVETIINYNRHTEMVGLSLYNFLMSQLTKAGFDVEEFKDIVQQSYESELKSVYEDFHDDGDNVVSS